jgi:hypothetical protein
LLHCRRKGGFKVQAFGRSRGGFTTKGHLRCNGVGLPIGGHIVGFAGSESHRWDALMGRWDSDAGAMLADKGYESDAIRHDL